MGRLHISDVLTVTTGILVSTRHMEGVYDTLDYLTGSQLFTHQLPKAAEIAKPYLFEQHPLLKEVSSEHVNKDNWKQWLDEQIAKFGEYLEVKTIAEMKK